MAAPPHHLSPPRRAFTTQLPTARPPRLQIFVFFILVNIFLAILNDAYIAVTEKFAAEPKLESKPTPTIRQRWRNLRAWIRQRQLDQNIERLRREQRQRELRERRAARRKEEERAKTLRGMGVEVKATGTRGGFTGAGVDGAGEEAA